MPPRAGDCSDAGGTDPAASPSSASDRVGGRSDLRAIPAAARRHRPGSACREHRAEQRRRRPDGGTACRVAPIDDPIDDEDVDLDDLVDVPPESVKSPIERLAEAFPGSELIDERS